MIEDNENKPIRILHIVGRMDRGGIETMIMNIYRNIDRSKVQFDFLAHYGREASYNEEIRSMGGKIYEMPALKDENRVYYWRLFKYIKALNKFFKEHKEYKVIHGHMTNTAAIYMPIAKKHGVKCMIAHSHSSHGKAGILGFLTNILQKPIYKNATDYFACSMVAANWFYPTKMIRDGKIKIIPNAVDANKFRFKDSKREEVRKQLGVENKYVIGCIGRFRKEKNQIYLVKLLQEIIKKEKNVCILFAGDGPCEEEVKKAFEKENLSSYTVFLGMRNDIHDIMQGIDILVMPSIFEGLPVTGIEAQASGLHIIASTGVTDEMNALNMVEYLSLDDKIEKWAKYVLKYKNTQREDTYEKIKEAGYDINTTVPWLQEFYIKNSEVK